MLKQKSRLEKQILQVKQKIARLPEGKFIFIKNGKYSKWYNSVNGKYHYISKSNKVLAEKLAYKEMLTYQLNEYLLELDTINYYLNHHKNISHRSTFEHPDYISLLKENFIPKSIKLSEWVNADYKKNTNHQESLKFSTTSGNLVRSKSEMLIDMSLSLHEIPFRYECALEINGYTYYPDFTIKHPVTGNLYYWEHFGLMDDEGYRGKAFSKLKTYSDAGIIEGINLIATYENIAHPLDSDFINKIIEHYFL